MKVQSLLKIATRLFWGSASDKIKANLLVARKLKNQERYVLAEYFHRRIERYGLYISVHADIGEGVRFPHPTGIVIGEGVSIGSNTRIYQNVTIGGARIGDRSNSSYPEVGANSVIFAGAVVVGDITIGEGSTVGANSVVLDDIPAGSVCVGIPARVVR